jgi:serine/threonine-protein kinase RsbW
MTEQRAPDPTNSANSADSTVMLRVPASSAFVAVLRSLAAGLAARCDLTLDEIEDLRIAVDEACALLLALAPPGEVLSAEFSLSSGELVVQVQVATRDDAELRRDGFGWTVLEALVSEVATEQAPGSMTITLTKRRESADR